MNSARVVLYEPATVLLSQFGMKRQLPEGVASDPLRVAKFDANTMFFDVFRLAWDGAILCLGPPLSNCHPSFTDLGFTGADDAPIAARWQHPRITQQYALRVTLNGQGPETLDAVRLTDGTTKVTIAVSQSQAALLADRRVLVTLSRDNPLPWIRDWATFYVRLHGANAILLYDNGSQSYSASEIAVALADIPGLKIVIIVTWPFPYGNDGTPGQPSTENFCQTGALDHARRCFCPFARSVLNVDIDELLPADGMSIFEQIEKSPFAVLLFRGIWAEAPGIESRDALKSVRHADCTYAWKKQMQTVAEGEVEGLCRTKWVAVPSRCGEDVEWGIHDIYPATQNARATQSDWRAIDQFRFHRHCRQINIGWKVDRWRSSRNFDAVCIPDRAMERVFASTFAVEDNR